MHFAGHHILSVNQFERADIEKIFEVADRMADMGDMPLATMSSM